MTAPHWAIALLRRVAPPDRVEVVLGDLEETHRRRVERRGPVSANLLTSLEALDVALTLVRTHRSSARHRGRKGRRMAGIHWLDVKLGLRMLVKYPGLSLVGGLGIAVAVAIGAGMFATASTMYTPLPFEEGDRVVAIENWDRDWNNQERRILHDFVSWRENLRSVEDLGAFVDFERNLIVEGTLGSPARVAAISASAFRLARVPALMGRPLIEDDETEGAAPVVVMGYDVWQDRLDGDPNVIGRDVRLGAVPHTVVGVMPEGFGFPMNHGVWVPLRLDAADYGRREGPDLRVFGRLTPDATLEQAEAELRTIASRAAADFPETHAQLMPRIMPYTLQLYDDMEGWELPILFFLVTMLLVVVCVNVAVLVYARTATRTGEIAVRSALGASRRRIVTQLFMEALVLSMAASGVGLVVAGIAFKQLGAFTERLAAIPFWIDFGLPPGTVLYVLLLALLGAVIVGVVPALKATGRRVQTALQHVGAGSSRMQMGRTWTALIVSQVAMTVAALPASVAVGRMAMEYGRADPGFPADEFLTAQLLMDSESPPSADADAYWSEFDARYRNLEAELIRRLEAEPGVADVIVTMGVPGGEPRVWIEVEGVAIPNDAASETAVRSGTIGHEVGIGWVDVNFFDAFDVPILMGRRFHAGDLGEDATAVIVNRAFAERTMGGASALGRRLRYVGRGGDVSADNVAMEQWYEIVGVVSDFPPNTLDPGIPRAKVYHAQARGEVYGASLSMRVEGGSPLAFARRFTEITTSLDPALRLRDLSTLDRVIRQEQEGWRLGGLGLGAVTLSVLLLAAAGIYAMMSFAVAQRRREIGIRAALGAHPAQLLGSIFSRALRQLAIGVVLGIGVAALMDFGTDGEFTGGAGALLLAGVVAFMMAVGLVATFGPARRGLRIQPTEALKEG